MEETTAEWLLEQVRTKTVKCDYYLARMEFYLAMIPDKSFLHLARIATGNVNKIRHRIALEEEALIKSLEPVDVLEGDYKIS